MGRCIVKLGELYVDWSTVVDAPITVGMTREELTDYVAIEYGAQGVRDLSERLARVDACGTSMRGHVDVHDTVRVNRAGPNETELTFEQLVEHVRRTREAALRSGGDDA